MVLIPRIMEKLVSINAFQLLEVSFILVQIFPPLKQLLNLEILNLKDMIKITKNIIQKIQKEKKTIHNVTFFNVDPPKTNHEEDEIHMKIDAITKIFFFKFEKIAKKENEKEISVDMKMYETAGKYLQNVTMKNEVKNKPVANEKQKIEKKKKIKFKKTN